MQIGDVGTCFPLVETRDLTSATVSAVRLVYGPVDNGQEGIYEGSGVMKYNLESKDNASLGYFNGHRKLFTAVCAELNERDMGLLLGLRNSSTSLEARA